ncbi:MAG TPA: hypothetical protein VGX16_06320 [Solirubrobacteraceae bacterium]|jgi:hypothetical protein|nr:hypothetical protein [Solirubrobacteraceae bacterium]
MSRQAEARVWWADVEDVRERIERRRLVESAAERRASSARARRGAHEPVAVERGPRRTVSISGHARAPVGVSPRRIAERGLAEQGLPTRGAPRLRRGRRRPRRRPVDRVGGRPDRLAGWAVALGLLMMSLAMISGHG